MNARREALAREKEILLMRSALCRLRLRRDHHLLRAALPWNHSLPTRVVMLATRALLAMKVARFAVSFFRAAA